MKRGEILSAHQTRTQTETTTMKSNPTSRSTPELPPAVAAFEAAATGPEHPARTWEKLDSMLHIAALMEDILLHPQQDPVERTESLFRFLAEKMCRAADMAAEFAPAPEISSDILSGEEKTKDLFERAWTVYSNETYDHSVSLVEDRLRQSGFGEDFLKGRTCFDGGCGTGRLAVALARMGAGRVVAADVGSASLEFFRRQIARYGLHAVEVVEMDVTDLGAFDSEQFDFVASNGVLHHTPRCLPGLDDHYRLVRPGGFLWLYLYGAGGFYWAVYDRMRGLLADVSPERFCAHMRLRGVREGMTYTMLDNFFAPREYFLSSEILSRLRKLHPLEWRHQRGPSIFDDPSVYTGEKYGKYILGPEGEVRLVIRKMLS